MDNVLGLETVGTYILHGRGTDGARNGNQVFGTMPSLGDAMAHKGVPLLAGSGLDQE